MPESAMATEKRATRVRARRGEGRGAGVGARATLRTENPKAPALPALPGASLLLHSSPAMRWCNGGQARGMEALWLWRGRPGRERGVFRT